MSSQLFAAFHPNPTPQSYIALTNLTISPGLFAPDVWTHTSPADTPYKLQPATLSLHLRLKSASPTARRWDWSAAEHDDLDETTVHYGLLSKALRRELEGGGEGVGLEGVCDLVKGVLAREGAGPVEEFVLEVRLPKAGMWAGSGVGVRWEGGTGRVVVVVEGMRVMCLVGVNANERRARQPVVVSIWIYFEEGEEGKLRDVIGVEQVLAQIVEETSFKTLEALVEFAVEEVQKRLLRPMLKGGWIQLRLEKPLAVSFADAPAIEVLRRIEG